MSSRSKSASETPRFGSANYVRSHKIGAFYYQAIGHTVFAVGRFVSAFVGLYFSPSWILLFLYAGTIVTSALAMNLTGYAGIAMIILTYLFEVSFPPRH